MLPFSITMEPRGCEPRGARSRLTGDVDRRLGVEIVVDIELDVGIVADIEVADPGTWSIV